MKIETEIELKMSPRDKYVLWGIIHHHLKEEELDQEEQELQQELLYLLDPYKKYERKYHEIQNSTSK